MKLLKQLFSKISKKNELVIKIKDTNTKPLIIYKGREINFVNYMSLTLDPNEFSSGYKFILHHYKKQDSGSGRIEINGFESLHQ